MAHRRLQTARYLPVICPRISPGGFLAVCKLTYQRPAVKSPACALVKVALPRIGLDRSPVNGTATPAFAPAAAGP